MVTGASRGIGLATARALCAEDAAVLLVARSAGTLETALETCRAAGGSAAALACDVTDPDAGERMLAEARATIGEPDVLVNNAGTARWRDLDDVPDEDWQAAWDLNVMAPLRAMRAVVPGHARTPMGPSSQCFQHRRQTPLGEHAGVLGRQGGAALAVAAVGGPLRRRRRAGQRDLPRSHEVGAVDRRGRPRGAVGGAVRAGERGGGDREVGRRAARSAAWPSPRRSPARSCSCARSARPTSRERRGAWTAAPCR